MMNKNKNGVKVGIITIHDTLNYGSSLQTFGLYYGFKKSNLDVEVIDYRCDAIYQKEFFPFRNANMFKKIILHLVRGGKYRKKTEEFKRFFCDNIKLSYNVYNKKTISNSLSAYDVFVVGADMVWNPKITGNDYTYFLNFVNDGNKKMAFSSSSGDCSAFERNDYLFDLLKDFSYIAMREDETAKYLSEKLKREVDHLQDPTILLDDEILNRLASKPKRNGYVLIYYSDLNGKIFKDAIDYANKYNLKVFYINIGRDVAGVESLFVPSIEEFLGYIKYADAVFTSSYHGLLFSLYYNKQVWYYSNNQMSRLNSVARSYNIQHRNGTECFSLYDKLSYDFINAKIKEYRHEYYRKINNVLGKAVYK